MFGDIVLSINIVPTRFAEHIGHFHFLVVEKILLTVKIQQAFVWSDVSLSRRKGLYILYLEHKPIIIFQFVLTLVEAI